MHSLKKQKSAISGRRVDNGSSDTVGSVRSFYLLTLIFSFYSTENYSKMANTMPITSLVWMRLKAIFDLLKQGLDVPEKRRQEVNTGPSWTEVCLRHCTDLYVRFGAM